MGLFDGVKKLFGVFDPDSLPYGEGDPLPFKPPSMNDDREKPRCESGMRHLTQWGADHCKGHNRGEGRSFHE